MYCNYRTVVCSTPQQILNTFIVIPKVITSTVILLYKTSTVILHYILLIKFHYSIRESQTLLTVHFLRNKILPFVSQYCNVSLSLKCNVILQTHNLCWIILYSEKVRKS